MGRLIIIIYLFYYFVSFIIIDYFMLSLIYFVNLYCFKIGINCAGAALHTNLLHHNYKSKLFYNMFDNLYY